MPPVLLWGSTDILYLQGMSCEGWERAMTAPKNIYWYVLLVLLEYLIWPAVIVEVYPEIHLLPLSVIKVEARFFCLAAE